VNCDDRYRRLLTLSIYTTAYIGLGSNLNDPLTQIDQAVARLGALQCVSSLRCSPLYGSQAIGPGDQPDYVNAVVRMDVQLPPLALLKKLQAIEHDQGRQRGVHWGPRTLDLDLLLYGTRCIDSEVLQVPHPHLYSRNFVLFPLYDIAEDLVFPNGLSLSSLINTLSADGLKKLE